MDSGVSGRSLLARLLLLALQAGVTSSGKLGLELLDAAGRVNITQLARVERMASVADVDLEFLASAASLE